MITKIYWNLHNHCKGGCTYCPSQFWGGDEPRSIEEYMNVLNSLIKHFNSIDRKIFWVFDGGEPLELHDFPMMLKACKENSGTIHLNSNGGRKWLDWWAIEPHIDHLNLSYHYWQNPKLIEYIIQTFQKNNKSINVIVPIRSDFFDEDIKRAVDLENRYQITVDKNQIYQGMNTNRGMEDYSEEQLMIMKGEVLVEEKIHFEQTTHEERVIEVVNSSPSFTGRLCNVGIEKLNITSDGWVSGSHCGNTQLGNIWQNSFGLPPGPSVCKMLVCTNFEDQQITKF